MINRNLWQVLAVSGNSNNSSIAGAWCVNANNESGNSNANIGSQLSYFIYFLSATVPCLLAKHKANLMRLVAFLSKNAKGNSR